MRGTPSLRRNRTTSRKPVHDNEACVLFAGKVRGTTVLLEAGGEGKVGRGRRARARICRSKRRVTLSEFRRGQNIFDTPHAKNFRLTMFAYKKRWKTPVLAVPCGGCDCCFRCFPVGHRRGVCKWRVPKGGHPLCEPTPAAQSPRQDRESSIVQSSKGYMSRRLVRGRRRPS